MAIKDFEITLKKLNTPSSKKDVGFVTGFNAISQYVEQVAKTQKGELPGDKNLGSDYFNYIFGGQIDAGVVQIKLAADIHSQIYYLANVSVNILSFTDSNIEFKVDYTTMTKIHNQNKSSCFVEVEI